METEEGARREVGREIVRACRGRLGGDGDEWRSSGVGACAPVGLSAVVITGGVDTVP